ncbi:MAG TPA: hypothetical protein VM122_10180 [Usitatibacter sp.]|nr:hypothetical protein [Usitatibacter sp.]
MSREKFIAVALAAAIGVCSVGLRAAEAPTVASIAPRAMEWAERVSTGALQSGAMPTVQQQAIARRSGVRNPASIRVLVVDEIPLPEEPTLKKAAAKVGLAQSSAAGMTLGYAVLVHRGYENDVRLLSHEFRHVAQYENAGGIRQFLAVHLPHLLEFGYEDSPFEVDARAHEIHGL